MNRDEILYAIALQRVKGVGPVYAKKLILEYGSATNLFNQFILNPSKINLPVGIREKLFTQKDLDFAKQQLIKAKDKGLHCLYFLNDDFPSSLLEIPDAPLLLFYDGLLEVLQNDKLISIVGTRNISSYGSAVCKELITGLKKLNPVIVSGFAYGVDICAHLEAVRNNLPTIAVLAHGFGTLYPKEHKRYYAEVIQNGGFLSEFMFEEQPLRENFLKRNRIVAGLSVATVVVESAEKGGALVTADIAGSYYKDVYAIPGRSTDVFSKGCNNLIKQNKAAMITSSEDLIEELGWKSVKQAQKIIQPTLFVELDNEETEVLEMVKEDSLHVDEIARTLGIPIYKLSNLLFSMEMKGLIAVLPGKMVKNVYFS